MSQPNLTPAQRDELRSRCDQPLLCVTAEEMLTLLAASQALDAVSRELDRLRTLVISAAAFMARTSNDECVPPDVAAKLCAKAIEIRDERDALKDQTP